MKKERERNINVREKHQLVALIHASTKHATQVCALTGNQTGNLSLCRMTPNQLSHTSQGSYPKFLKIFINKNELHINCMPNAIRQCNKYRRKGTPQSHSIWNTVREATHTAKT